MSDQKRDALAEALQASMWQRQTYWEDEDGNVVEQSDPAAVHEDAFVRVLGPRELADELLPLVDTWIAEAERRGRLSVTKDRATA